LTGRVRSVAAVAETRGLGFCTGASDHSRDRRVRSGAQRVYSSGGRSFDRTRPVTSGPLLDSHRTSGAACPVTCDRTRPIARGALWTPIGHWGQRVRSNGVARPITATTLCDMHCCCLSCNDRTRLVSLTSASGHHDFHCAVL
jgi:hypothetical protein